MCLHSTQETAYLVLRGSTLRRHFKTTESKLYPASLFSDELQSDALVYQYLGFIYLLSLFFFSFGGFFCCSSLFYLLENTLLFLMAYRLIKASPGPFSIKATT